jgi:methyltransferase family protein
MSDNIKGQILPGSAFGNALTELARKSSTIVEAGTWHGQGSTKCLAAGLEHPDQRMWSIEPDNTCFSEASTCWQHESRITFIHGHTLDVLDQLPDRIDLLLLDGDDWTSFAECGALHSRCKWIALDDTNEMKNKNTRESLMAEGWIVLHDEPRDRHGWTVFEAL